MFFEKALRDMGLGTLLARPERVTGGLMHEMYSVRSTRGRYALKLLNPAIMRRPGVLDNYARAERLERLLQARGLPIVPALEADGRKLRSIDGRYFYMFDWVDGVALPWDGIAQSHCEVIGGLLGRIHWVERTKARVEAATFEADWDAYTDAAEASGCEIAGALRGRRDLLYAAQAQYNAAMRSLPDVVCICNGDMDSKNVLWAEGRPAVIDLECLDYGNPLNDLFQLALSWSGGVLCDVDTGRLRAFIGAYRRAAGPFEADWPSLYGLAFGWLEWLEYNVKRALGIECGGEEERLLGIAQAREAIARVVYFDSVRGMLLEALEAIDLS